MPACDEQHIDVHQHLWPPALVEALRTRRTPPYLDGWKLHLAGEPPYDADPADHAAGERAEQARRDGLGRALVSLSSPLGIESLPPREARYLLDAFHEGAAALPGVFGGWASACLSRIDARALDRVLDQGFAGLQLPATALAGPQDLERSAPLLDVLEARDLPLFVHPGPAAPAPGGSGPGSETGHGACGVPGWWAAAVPYVQQMHAAWFAFRVAGRARHPRLRVCFAMLAGLAPLHGERVAARGGGRGDVDPGVFVETSSYGPRAVDAVVRALGVDVIVHGTDRPYAGPADLGLGEAARHAFRVASPHRLLLGKERTRDV